jgi:hypothetical protein
MIKILLLVCVLSSAALAQQKLICNHYPVITVRGNHNDVGAAIGSAMGSRILQYLEKNPFFNDTVLPFYNSPAGRPVVEGWMNQVRKSAPFYAQEAEATAQAAGLPSEFGLLLNMEAEIGAIASTPRPPQLRPHCSDIHIVGPDGAPLFHGHNEDGDILAAQFGYFSNITYTDMGENDRWIFAFNYPGQLSGNAFGLKFNGMSISTNALFPTGITPGQHLPRNFVNHATMFATSPAEAVMIVQKMASAYGWNLNVAHLPSRQFFDVEVGPGATTLVKNLTQGSPSTNHFNNYKYLDISFTSDPSSVARQARANALPVPKSANTLLNVLGDTQGDYPIFRTGKYPDSGVMTLATALYDFKAGTMNIWCNGQNPKLNPPQQTIKF